MLDKHKLSADARM